MSKQLPIIWKTTLLSPQPILLLLPFISTSSSAPIYYINVPRNYTVATSSVETLMERSSSRQVLPRASMVLCSARRRVRYEVEDEEDDGGEWSNEAISVLELYSQSRRGEALIVHAVMDEQDVQVVIFKGFSSSLSFGTSPDPSRSILPARAVIKSIDRVKGPFDPSNIEYLEKGLTWEAFKIRLSPPPPN